MNPSAFFAAACTFVLGCSSKTDDAEARVPRAAKLEEDAEVSRERSPVMLIGLDDIAAGALPAGWIVSGTHPEGQFATWQVVADASAPSSPNALALTATNHNSGEVFNICWTDDSGFEDGSIELAFKAVSGEEDQGGGPMWRVKDSNNYYICRMNPLEDNFRLYVVKDGVRSQLKSAPAKIESGTWHTIRAEHSGSRIRCWLDGILLIEAQDNRISGSGGVGLWTKADACTSFDDITLAGWLDEY